MKLSTKLLAGMAAIALGLPGVACADATYTFTYTATNGNVLGSGTFTTGASNPSGSFFKPSLLITSITGTYRNADITGLLAANSYYSNDNIFYTSPPAGSGSLDIDGVAFTTTAGTADFFRGLGGYGTLFTKTGSSTATSNIGGTFTVTPAVAAVPEAASWVMMILGIGAVGFAMRRREKITTRVSYAG